GRGFLPAVGTLSAWRPPSGPGVRLDSGYEEGHTVPQEFDSLIAKLIVTGATREQAIQRSRRALAEMQIDGMPTVLPFHRVVLEDPAYASEPFSVHTRWIETEFNNTIAPYSGAAAGDEAETGERERVTVEVGGKRLEVVLPAGLGALGSAAAAGKAAPARKRGGRKGGGAAAGGDALVSPMQGTIVKVVVEDGATVAEGDTIVVLEAMKMEQPLTAHKAGTITGLSAEVGGAVSSGAVICEIKDA
ncbi:Biotin-requiring enzyme, partial [Thermomonospora echinospora]